ncbi:MULTISPECIES: DUF2993 domain-containing protein [Fischerella]|uniref:LmeA family phospholipid-binding protein n=1 Tax=Fischerella TaxID=1190 RepID=UPI0002FF5C8E|nr:MULTISPECIES: DUF2993 domain-containing protein [Fischerella]MBD2430797.1 DUF2993 domain-containing protein [Fischerella sp. FACHB-380]
MSENPGLGEQALNKAVEMGLSSQLDEVENLDVNVKAEPLNLVQGQVEAVSIDGEGLVMQQELRMEKIEMEISSVAINPLSAAFGKIELTKPTQGRALVVLTEEDINRAFNSEYIRSQLQSQKIRVDGQLMTVVPQKVEFRLPGDGKVALSATLVLKESNETHKISFSAVPRVSENGETLTLENVEYGDSQEVSLELTKALVDATSQILNLKNFNLEGIYLKIKRLEVEAGKLILQAEAEVEQIPSA